MSDKGERKGGVEEYDRVYKTLKGMWKTQLTAGMYKMAGFNNPDVWARCAAEYKAKARNPDAPRTHECLRLGQIEKQVVPIVSSQQEAVCKPKADVMKKVFILDSTLAERQAAVDQLLKCWRPYAGIAGAPALEYSLS